ncbi:Hypothetical protein DHA2_152078, partial [Giardia duodenalis]
VQHDREHRAGRDWNRFLRNQGPERLGRKLLEDSSNTAEQTQSKADPDPEKARRRIANRVNNALSFGAVAKALRALDDTPMVDIKSEKAKAALSALHPCVLPEGYVGLDCPPSMNSTGLEPATEEEMRKALFGTLNKKASGVSGLGPVQLR